MILDLISLFLCINFAYWYRLGEKTDFLREMELFAFVSFVLVSSFYLLGCYNYNISKYQLKHFLRQFGAVFVTLTMMILYVFATRSNVEGLLGRGVIFGGFSLFLVVSVVYRWLIHLWVDDNITKQRWLVVLSGKYIRPFITELKKHSLKESYFYLTSENSDFEDVKALGNRHIGSIKDLKKAVKEGHWSGVLVGVTDDEVVGINSELMNIRFKGGKVMSLTDFYEIKWSKVPVYFLSKSWFIFSHGFSLVNDPLNLRLKRFSDILGAGFLLVFSFPILLVSAILIKLEDRGPILYRQKRVGRNGQVFEILKLRSMRVDAEKNGAQYAQKNDCRVTFVGKIIRTLRIDEIPQVLNVLRGEMSFVGPRPERPEFVKQLDKEIAHYSLRNLIKPGITGLAQVKYRYGDSSEDSLEKLQYDLYYVKNHSMWLDTIIVFRTFKTVLKALGR